MEKVAYLTIDDCPTPSLKRKLDILLARNIPAVLFCSGQQLEALPKQAHYAIEKGFIIGNHAYDHPHFSAIPLETCLEQIDRTDAIIDDLYTDAGVPRPVKWFRFPYGDKGALTGDDLFGERTAAGQARYEAIQNHLRKIGYTKPRFENITYDYYREYLQDAVDWFWTYDVMEWSIYEAEPMFGIDSPEKMFARMDENEPEEGRGLNDPHSAEIILTHDHLASDELFEPIIERLLTKDLVFEAPPLA